MSDAASDGRSRIWAAVVYPESLPADWRSILDSYHIQWAESPLHDRDVNESTGELKKAHIHLVLDFDGKKSFSQVSAITSALNAPIPERCHSKSGTVRYFCHLDNPEKAQYSPSEIISHGGFDVAACLVPTSARRYELIREMQDWCWRNDCCEFADLMEYASQEHFDDWYPLLCDSCAYVMTQYLRSRRLRKRGVPDEDR